MWVNNKGKTNNEWMCKFKGDLVLDMVEMENNEMSVSLLSRNVSIKGNSVKTMHMIAKKISDILELSLTESQVDGVSTGMYSLIRENPEFVTNFISP